MRIDDDENKRRGSHHAMQCKLAPNIARSDCWLAGSLARPPGGPQAHSLHSCCRHHQLPHAAAPHITPQLLQHRTTRCGPLAKPGCASLNNLRSFPVPHDNILFLLIIAASHKDKSMSPTRTSWDTRRWQPGFPNSPESLQSSCLAELSNHNLATHESSSPLRRPRRT